MHPSTSPSLGVSRGSRSGASRVLRISRWLVASFLLVALLSPAEAGGIKVDIKFKKPRKPRGQIVIHTSRGAPRLIGRTLRDADALLKKYGIKYVVVEKPIVQGEDGIVIDQQPNPGRYLRRGDRMVIWVSALSSGGQDPMDVPGAEDPEDLPEDYEDPYDTGPSGGQDPTPTTPSSRVLVPDLQGMSAMAAKQALEGAGLTPLRGGSHDGVVRKQSPKAGVELEAGSEVKYWLQDPAKAGPAAVHHVKLPGDITLRPRHTGKGDREFKGHGPRMVLYARYAIGKRHVFLELKLTAREIGGDRSEGVVTRQYRLFQIPTGKRVVRVKGLSRQFTKVFDRIDKNGHKMQRLSVGGWGSFKLYGDRNGKDLHDYTRVEAHLSRSVEIHVK